MKILCLTYEYPPIGGGGSTCIEGINKNLKGHEIRVLTTGYKGVMEKEHKYNVNIKRLNCYRNARFKASLMSMGAYVVRGSIEGIRSDDMDIIHAYFAIPSGIPGYVLKKVKQKPLIVSILGGDVYDPARSRIMDWGAKKAIRRVLDAADKVTAVSNDLRGRALNIYDGEVEVVPNGIDTGIFSPKPRGEEVSRSKSRILSVGRLVKRKNYQELIMAFSRVANNDSQLVIIGGGPERGTLMRLANKEGVGDRVSFPGYVDLATLVEHYRQADIFAMTSTYEGQGRTIMEAMACEKPVVAPRVGGVRDVIEDGRTGYMYSPGDQEALTDSLKDLLYDSEKREAMGQKARERILERFDIVEIASRMSEIYEEVKKK